MRNHPQHIVRLPAKLGLTSVVEMVGRFGEVINSCREDGKCSIVVDMSRVRFIQPTSMAALSALLAYVIRRETIVSGEIVPAEDERVNEYLSRMDFYNFLKVPMLFSSARRSSEGRFREVVEVEEEGMIPSVRNDLVSIMRNNIAMSDQAIRALTTALDETLDNVFHHAQSPVNAIVCAQSYPNKRTIEIAIADCGCGFFNSLRRNPVLEAEVVDSISALQLAIQMKVTSRPEKNAGIGLFITSELVKQNQGDMIIHSHDGLYVMRRGEPSFSNTTYWPGSIVGLRFYLNNPMNITEIYDRNLPMSKEDTLDDEDDYFELQE